MRYSVEIVDFTRAGARDVARFDGLSLCAAWRKVIRHARRGIALYGGAIDRANWGARGGALCGAYRSAVIRVQS